MSIYHLIRRQHFVSLQEKVKNFTTFATHLVRGADSPGLSGNGSEETKHVLVVEQAAGKRWKIVEANIDADGIRVTGAQSFEEGIKGSASEMVADRNKSTVVLVPNSGKSVCRVIEVGDAPSGQLDHMVALRLEAELPYPVTDSVWAYKPIQNGKGTIASVSVIAVASDEVASAESELAKGGIQGTAMEFAAGGLAELANASGSPTGTTAVAKLDHGEAILAIAHDAVLCYVRHIRVHPIPKEGDFSTEEWATALGQELRQSIYDYTLRNGSSAPTELMVTGERMGVEGSAEALGAHLDIPVVPIDSPGVFELSKPESIEGDFLTEYSVLAGALVAMRRRMLGQPTAAPPLRRKRRAFGSVDWDKRRFRLFSLNAVLLLLFTASLFGVQSLRLNSADRLVRESQPLLQGLERNREEVDVLLFEDRRRRSVLDTMMALSEALPPAINIETLSIDSRGKISISGKAKTVEVASDTAIAALRDSPFFINPKFNGATREKKEFSFQITCELRGGSRRIKQ